MTTIPMLPIDGARETARVTLRFEDVTQDGRLVLEALPSALAPTVWGGMLARDLFARACQDKGITAILTRFVLEGTPGPFSAMVSLEAEATYRIAISEDDRIMLDVWAELYAPIGRTYGTTGRAGERALAGRVFGQHAFTRPFAPKGQRRVTLADVADFPQASRLPRMQRGCASTPSVAYPTLGDVSAADVPLGATALESGPRLDPVPVAFGLVHTDSNMHVNSLAYLRIFEEAALRRFAELDKGTALLGRSMDITYRKPCFAGQTMRIVAQAFEESGRLGFSAALVTSEDAASGRWLTTAVAHTHARMAFDS